MWLYAVLLSALNTDTGKELLYLFEVGLFYIEYSQVVYIGNVA